MTRILFSNVGYARGIDGSLGGHVSGIGRHLYASRAAQRRTLSRLKAIVDREAPDLCCLVEIDRGSPHSGFLNQIEVLLDAAYPFHDVASKYGAESLLERMPLHAGKSNGFMSRQAVPFERLYFRSGSKRLVYSIALPDGVTVLFAHFSLNRRVRARQMHEMRALARAADGEVVLMGDFNIMSGFGELQPLLEDGALRLLNRADEPTFRFHRRSLVLDLCLCSAGLAGGAALTVLPQPFSDHDALLLEI